MSSILYEHPLNERIRNYLKLEQLFCQVDASANKELTQSHLVFFNALFAIFDTLERNDIRGDLIKDLEKLEQNLVVWSKAPEIDTSAIDENLQQTVKLISQLRTSAPRWLNLKQDKFLSALKQRFAIQGGSSTFDLPQLQFWLNSENSTSTADITHWLAQFDQIKSAIGLILKFIRQRADFETINTDKAFYQDNGEGLLLLRIKIDGCVEYYPTISGNRFRYSVRFVSPCEQSGRKYITDPISFKLARC